MENSVNRNRVAHTHEVVENIVHWFDDKIFRLYPTWDECVAGLVFSPVQLEQFFGKPIKANDGDLGGPGNYARCVKTGIGRNIIGKMLAGTENEGVIKQARAFSQVLNK